MDLIETLKENGIYEYIMNIEEEKTRNKILSECKIEEFKKRDFLHFFPEKETLAMAFLSGSVNMIVYVDDVADYTVTWNSDMWFGIAQALSEGIRECEIVFQEDTRVLFFPLKDILFGNPKGNIDLWIKVSKMAARKALEIQRKIVEKGALSTEAYFLKKLVDNGYKFDLSVQDIANNLSINLRTLQRAIQLLTKQGYIKRDSKNKSIVATSNRKVDDYLEEFSNR